MIEKSNEPYKGYLSQLQKQALSLFDEILAGVGWNFDDGDEIEVAVCQFLRLVLPDRYAVCRGHIVTADGLISEGDDVIIYDYNISPTARIMDKYDFNKKNRIPIEAVYAYIEVKNTLDQKSFNKALKQVDDFKAMQRDSVHLNSFRGFNLNSGENVKINITPPKHYPKIKNPLFGCVFARHVDKRIKTAKQFKEMLTPKEGASYYLPDLIVAGNFVCIPVIENDKEAKWEVHSPFYYADDNMPIGHKILKNRNSFGIAIINLLKALGFMELGDIKYNKLLQYSFQNDALNNRFFTPSESSLLKMNRNLVNSIVKKRFYK